jgi:hypothetical protein
MKVSPFQELARYEEGSKEVEIVGKHVEQSEASRSK